MATWHVIFTGRVQGVGFRQSCLHQAHIHEITGWVRNLSNGSVEAVVQGKSVVLKEWLTWCSTNSPFASVQKVKKQDVTDSKIFSTFEIRF